MNRGLGSLGSSSLSLLLDFLRIMGRRAVGTSGRGAAGIGGGRFAPSSPDVAECPVSEGANSGAGGGRRRLVTGGVLAPAWLLMLVWLDCRRGRLGWLGCLRGSGGASLRGGRDGADWAVLLRR